MNTKALEALRSKLARGEPVFGLWVTLDAAAVSEMAVALGLDWIVIDAEHGYLDWAEVFQHVRSGVRSNTVVLVRITELNAGAIKRALDIGADGVVVPWIETADQLEAAVAYARYPLEGLRGLGIERATGWGECTVEHSAEANDSVLVVPVIETVRAGANIADLCQVDGVELYFFGPGDFSSTAGYRGQWEGPGVAEQLAHARAVIKDSGRTSGVIARNPEDLIKSLTDGYRMLGLGMDVTLLLKSLHQMLAAAGIDRTIRPGFDVGQ